MRRAAPTHPQTPGAATHARTKREGRCLFCINRAGLHHDFADAHFYMTPPMFALGVGLYILVECVRLIFLLRYQRHLHDNRTPLSENFDRRAWAHFFVEALQRECELGPSFVRDFVSSMFDLTPVDELTRGDVDEFLRFYISCQEHIDGPLEPWALELADRSRLMIEASLGMTFPIGPVRHLFIRINHPKLDHHAPAAYMRPLPIAILFRMLRLAVCLYLRHWLKFERWVDETTGFVFWHHRRSHEGARRRDGSPPRERRGLLFVTGLGQGISLYPHHVSAFVKDGAMARRYSDICVCEAPGISGTPLRASLSYPTAREAVQAIERFKRHAFDEEDSLGGSEGAVTPLDVVAHSAGTFLPSYATRYSPSLFDRFVFAEAPACFFTHAAKSWPILFSRERFTLRGLLQTLWECDVNAVASWLVMSEVHHQFGLKNTTWFAECCRECAHMAAPLDPCIRSSPARAAP